MKGRLLASVERPGVAPEGCIHAGANVLQIGAESLRADGIPLEQVIAGKGARKIEGGADLFEGAVAQQEGLADLHVVRLDLPERAQRIQAGKQHQPQHAAEAGEQHDLRAPLDRLRTTLEDHGVLGPLYLNW